MLVYINTKEVLHLTNVVYPPQRKNENATLFILQGANC